MYTGSIPKGYDTNQCCYIEVLHPPVYCDGFQWHSVPTSRPSVANAQYRLSLRVWYVYEEGKRNHALSAVLESLR